MIFERHANLKYRFGNRTFLVQRILCRYGREKMRKRLQEYIQNQLQEDWEYDQMTPKGI